MADFRLSHADAVLINYAGALTLARLHDAAQAERSAMWAGILREALPHVHHEVPRIAALARAVQAYLDADHSWSPVSREFARIELDQALGAVMEWRGAMALDGFQKIKERAAGDAAETREARRA